MAIASTTHLPASENSAEPKPAAETPRKSRMRPWMIAPLVILVGVLLRMWLERHPSEFEIVGIVDTA